MERRMFKAILMSTMTMFLACEHIPNAEETELKKTSLYQQPHEDSLSGKCALILTDDDVPSGHAIAQAMYGNQNELGKRLLTQDVVAVTKGFFDRGIKCVDVIDTHNDAIDPVPLNSMTARVLTMRDHREEIRRIFQNDLSKYGVAAMVGYHAPAGKTGILPHTFDDSVKVLKINGQVVGEVAHGIISLAASRVPVAVISGSHWAVEEAKALIPGIQGVKVRWLDETGQIKYLSEQESSKKLYQAAKSFQMDRLGIVVHMPMKIEYSLYIKGLIPDKIDGLEAGFSEYKKSALPNTLFSFDRNTESDERSLLWRVDSLELADKTIPFVRSYFKGVNTWDLVTQAYQAYKKEDYSKAVYWYSEALKKNPFDLPTNCRLAAAFRMQGDLANARKFVLKATNRLGEIAKGPMREWCVSELEAIDLAASK